MSLTLYIRDNCPFSQEVLDEGAALGIDFDLKNVADDGIADELVERGGKKQEPYLVDEDTGIAMYEAPLIVQYLRHHYSDGQPDFTAHT